MKLSQIILISIMSVAGVFTGQFLAEKYPIQFKPENKPPSVQITGKAPGVEFLPIVNNLQVVVISVNGKDYLFATKDGIGAICAK